MTREETKKIVMIISASYPNWKPQDLKFTVDTWALMLEEYDYNQIAVALKAYIASDTSGFAPSIGQLIDKMHILTSKNEMNELEAWNMVYKAICNSGYNSECEFAKLPEACQRAVGSPANLKEWAMMDIDIVQSVEQSHFIRNYWTVLHRMRDEEKMPKSIRKLIEQSQPKQEAIEKKGITETEVEREEIPKGTPMPAKVRKRMEELLG